MAGFRLAPKAARARRNPWQRRRIAIGGYTTTYYNETGSIDNAAVISGVDTYGIGYPDTGTLDNSIVVSGTDTFDITFAETGSVGVTNGVDPLDSIAQGGLAFLFTKIYHDTYSLSDLSTLGSTITLSGSDTYSTTITYVESGSLGATSGISGVDTFNVYSDQGSVANSATIDGADAFYSTSYIYEETGSVNGQAILSGTDGYGVPETYDEFGSIDELTTLSGADGIFYRIELTANVGISPIVSKSANKTLLKTIRPKTKIKDNHFYTAMAATILTTPKISRLVTKARPLKSHKVREELSRRS